MSIVVGVQLFLLLLFAASPFAGWESYDGESVGMTSAGYVANDVRHHCDTCRQPKCGARCRAAELGRRNALEEFKKPAEPDDEAARALNLCRG
jgi:hypothetical protein